ncbi:MULTISPECIES: MoxR family ATPase [unclassified Actinobaculum]|uniref:AAA family ATPase n=1 Tax=unclassified Actinobaculum TaxID=2609299 RepID=UPI001F0B87B4|nr:MULTISPECIES: MoxR family ATPase [unclassified Actinobaculum]
MNSLEADAEAIGSEPSGFTKGDKVTEKLADGMITDEQMARVGSLLDRVREIFRGRVVGQEALYNALVTSLMARGHVLLESVPGLAKTTAATTLAEAFSGTFSRIQCTPDLMPNDIVGTQIYSYESGRFTTQLGPVHANMVLLDEINRSSAKTQSAMLEAMQERQTSIGGRIYRLPEPFMVMATQNPLEEEGTYVLPEAQMDRFLMKEILGYPEPNEEVDILTRTAEDSFGRPEGVEPISTDDILFLQSMTRKVYVDSSVAAYIVAIINTTRGGGPRPIADIGQRVTVGASPRGGLALMQTAQARALQAGRNYIIPDDVKELRYPVLRHRIVRTYDALASGVTAESIIDSVFNVVPTP